MMFGNKRRDKKIRDLEADISSLWNSIRENEKKLYNHRFDEHLRDSIEVRSYSRQMAEAIASHLGVELVVEPARDSKWAVVPKDEK